MAFDKKKIWWCLILWSYFDMHRFHELYVHCRFLDDVFLCVFEIDCSSKVLKNAKFEMRNGLESNHVAILLSFQYNPRVMFPWLKFILLKNVFTWKTKFEWCWAFFAIKFLKTLEIFIEKSAFNRVLLIQKGLLNF